jgi:hypothetical protein
LRKVPFQGVAGCRKDSLQDTVHMSPNGATWVRGAGWFSEGLVVFDSPEDIRKTDSPGGPVKPGTCPASFADIHQPRAFEVH